MVESIRHNAPPTIIEPGRPRSDRARIAVTVAFAVNGLVFASWIARIPALRDTFGLTGTQLGLLLLCVSVGAVAALPASGPLVHRIGPSRAVAGGAGLVALGLVAAAAGIAVDAVALTGAGLLLAGAGTGTWDVAMNVEGAAVERGLARPIMPRLHGWFSIGTVVGAGLGAATSWLAVPLAAQLVVVSAAGLVAVLLAVRAFLPAAPPERIDDGRRASSGVGRAWREPRTLAVGLMTLGFAFAEGSANDWLAVALVDGFGADNAVGAAGFAVFVAAMTVGRLFGGPLLERFGRVTVLRAGAGVALAGLVLVLVGGHVAVALAGAVLWGLGAALGFPTGVSASADDPVGAAARVSVVSTIAYTAFLAGPPLIGPLADSMGMPGALVVVVAALALSLLTAGAARRPGPVAQDAPV
jgi:fucose permease